MPSGKCWLSLKTRPFTGQTISRSPRVFILIPKKKVRLATRRNRLRRLIREAIRKDGLFVDSSKTYLLRVLQMPERLSFLETQRALQDLQ